MKSILILMAIFNFLSFFWSIIGVFKKIDEPISAAYRILQLNSIILWVSLTLALVRSDLSNEMLAINIVIQVLCSCFFWLHSRIVKRANFSIVFSTDTPKQITTQGFYKKIRHPFYMIYLATYFSIALSTQDLVSIVFSVTIFIIYYRAAKFEESKFSASPLGEAYKEYQSRTGMFFPRLKIP